MTEEHRVIFGGRLKQALDIFDGDARLEEFKELMKAADPAKLARCVATPAGRAFLRGGIQTEAGRTWLGLGKGHETAELRVTECDILRWGFTAELMQIGLPREKAVSLVDQGITLRDIRSKTSGELIRLRNAKAPGYAEGPGWEDFDLAEQGDQRQWFMDLKDGLRAREDELFSIEFYDLLVVSDFHLAAGNRPSREGIARLSPTEDFYFDDAFFRFLYGCEKERRDRDGYPYELVFNGDVIDFVQVVVSSSPDPDPWDSELALPQDLQQWAWEADAESYADALVQRERLWHTLDGVWQDEQERGAREQMAYELETVAQLEWTDFLQDRKAVAQAKREEGQRKVLAMSRTEALNQLADVCQGHRRMFQGLAWFLAHGNRLVVMRGNHDIQWYWPEVQTTFVGWLRELYDELDRECQDPACRHRLPVAPEELRVFRAAPPEETGRFLPLLRPDELEKQVDFDHTWYYYRDRLAYLEHGGQHEAVDAHRYFLLPVYDSDKDWEDPRPSPTIEEVAETPIERAEAWLPVLEVTAQEEEIDPALGSLGNVFLVNNLEIELPNFERPGYNKVYLPWLLYHRPRVLWVALRRAISRLLKAWKDWAARWPDLMQRHSAKLRAYASLTGLPEACTRELDETRWVRLWRRPAPAVWYLLLNLLPVLAVVLVIALALGIAEGLKLVSVADWFPAGLKGLLGLGPPGEKRPVWDFVWGAAKTLLVGFASYWALTLVRDWIGLGEDYLFQPSLRVARILKRHDRDVPYILFGHDHAHNAQPVDVGKQCSAPDCTTQLTKRHVHFKAGRLEVPKADCPHCKSSVDTRALRRQMGKALRQKAWPDRYTITCPHCHEETSVGQDLDLSMEVVKCEQCGVELTNEDVERNPTLSAPVRAFGVTSLTCGSCGEELPDEIVDQVRMVRHSVIFACPSRNCGEMEWQWLNSWHLDCPNPDCGKKPRKSDLYLTEDQPFIHCTCNTSYPVPPPVKRWYLNTGTWMHMFATERKRLVREAHEYTFVRMIDTHRVLASEPDSYMDPEIGTRPQVELLRWNDCTQRVEACETFRGTAEG